ncbi:MAG: serine/threonine protein kinase [Rhodobacteraceae bacterium]|nr:serine/threonine protein kinase [Paracoccaceae bacterium]
MIEPRPGDIFHRGQVLNNTYEIEGILGRGGTGEVYSARNLISGRVVAIKALNQQFSGNDAYVDLMRREEQMRDVIHDAVVRYSECSRSDQGQVFLVMDFVDGPSLADVMAQRRPEPRELLIIAHRVAEGLVAAHGHGIVHRDLSPDNIILRGGNPERATIIDFGIAKDTAAGARTIVGNDFAGKYEYASPEQLEGRAEARSDLYSLGAVLLAAWRGEVPFAGATPGEMVRRKQQPLDTTGVPEPLKGIIGWLAAPRAEDRPPDAQTVVARLEALLRPASQKGRRPTTVPGSGRGAKAAGGRERGRGGLVALLLVLLLAGAAGGAWYAGYLDRFITKPLPVAAPYRLEAAAPKDGRAVLSGNAPDAETAALLRQGYAAAAGAVPAETALTLASGMPLPDWPRLATEGLGLAAKFEDWSFALSDRTVRIGGIAADSAAKATAVAALTDWAGRNGLTPEIALQAGPAVLPRDRVSGILKAAEDCGPLVQKSPPGKDYALGETIAVSGEVATQATADALKADLAAIAGDRGIEVAPVVMNPTICTFRSLLPEVGDMGVQIRLRESKTGAARLDGAFRLGEQLGIDVLVPDSLKGQTLWVVMAAEVGNIVTHHPNPLAAEDRVDAIGTVADGVRAIQILPIPRKIVVDGVPMDPSYVLEAADLGRSEILAILSDGPLFAERPTSTISLQGFLESYGEALKSGGPRITAISARVMDVRP